MKLKLDKICSRTFTKNALEQFESVIMTVMDTVSEQVRQLSCLQEKKTISVKEIELSVRILFLEPIRDEALTFAKEHLEKFEETISTDNPHCSRQKKSGILFPPSLTEKSLRRPGFLVTKTSPVYLASVMEALVVYISRGLPSDRGFQDTLTVRHLELKMVSDPALSHLLKTCRISFLSGGVLTADTKEISNCLFLRRLPFERAVREITDSKISKDVCVLLQHYIEQHIVTLLQKAYRITTHTGRVRMLATDLELAKSI